MAQTGGQPAVYGADQLRLQRNPAPKQTNIRLRKAQSLRGWTVAQWWDICLASVRLWVLPPVVHNNKQLRSN